MACKSFYVLSILRIVFSIFFVQLWNRIETNDSAWNKSSFLYLLFFYFIYTKNDSETVSLSKKEKRKKKCIAQETFSYYKQVISFQLPYYYSKLSTLIEFPFHEQINTFVHLHFHRFYRQFFRARPLKRKKKKGARASIEEEYKLISVHRPRVYLSLINRLRRGPRCRLPTLPSSSVHTLRWIYPLLLSFVSFSSLSKQFFKLGPPIR